MSQSLTLKEKSFSPSQWKTIDPSAALKGMESLSVSKDSTPEPAAEISVPKPEWYHTVFHTTSSSLNMIWHKKGDRMILTVPCASSWVDNENEIQRFLREHTQKLTGVRVSYANKKMVFECNYWEEDLPETIVKGIEELLERANQHFDLLPTCMCCQRTIAVEVEAYLDELRTVCGICHDSRRLQHDHERLIEQHKIEAAREWREEIKNRQPIRDIFKVGIKGGLIGCGIGFVFFVLSLYLPMFRYMPFFPGAAAGLYIVTRLWNIDFYTKATRFLASTFAAVLTMFLVSGSWVFLCVRVLHIYEPTRFMLFNNGAVYNLTLGMFGYMLGAWVSFTHGE